MKIPFGKPYIVTPAQSKDGIAQGLIDGYMDHDGAYKSRPGFNNWSDMVATYGIDGVYVDKNGRTLIVTFGYVYIVDTDGTARICTMFQGLNIGSVCTFAEDENYVFVANGTIIYAINTAAKTGTRLASASAPDGVTHVACIQGYLVANGNTGIPGDVFYTGPSTSADYLSVFEVFNNESLPDGCSAVMTDGQFIYSFGQNSTELSVNDGTTPWAKYGVGFIPYGIEAPNSVTRIDNTFYWLGEADNALRVLKMSGGNAQTVSTPYDSVINNFTTTSDAYAFSCGFEGHTFYVLQFPTENYTLVYHLQKDAWYRWGYYDVQNATYKSFLGRCHAYHPVLNKNIIGTKGNGLDADGLVESGYLAFFEGFSDFNHDIRFELTSGNITGGTYKQKRASRMRFQLQRGETTNYTSLPVLRWTHRDDGGKWSAERSISLGSMGQYGYLGTLERAGMYRERQHRLIFTDQTCQLVLVDVEETVKLLED